MKGKNLLILAVVAAVLVGLAAMNRSRTRIAEPSKAGQSVFASLPVNDVARIEVASAAQTATVARVNDVWVSENRFRHPADFGKVRDALLKLSDLKIGQTANLSDAQKKRLKLAPPAPGATNAGTVVSLIGGDGRKLASLLLGDEHKRPSSGDDQGYGGYADGRYISPDGGRTVYLVQETFGAFATDPQGWLDTQMASVPAAEVVEVTASSPGQAPLVFDKQGDNMVLRGLAGDEEMDSTKNYSIKSPLSYLRFKDVADPALNDAALGMTNAATYRAVTEKGEIYTATIGGSPAGAEERYVRLSVEAKPAEPVPEPAISATSTNAAEAAAQAAKEKQEREKKRKELEQQVAEKNRRVSGWTYLVAKYDADQLCPKRESVVKKKEPPAPASTNAPAASPVVTDQAPAQANP